MTFSASSTLPYRPKLTIENIKVKPPYPIGYPELFYLYISPPCTTQMKLNQHFKPSKSIPIWMSISYTTFFMSLTRSIPSALHRRIEKFHCPYIHVHWRSSCRYMPYIRSCRARCGRPQPTTCMSNEVLYLSTTPIKAEPHHHKHHGRAPHTLLHIQRPWYATSFCRRILSGAMMGVLDVNYDVYGTMYLRTTQRKMHWSPVISTFWFSRWRTTRCTLYDASDSTIFMATAERSIETEVWPIWSAIPRHCAYLLFLTTALW